ncbi:MAG: TlpA family protein disulfide reductase [Ignavibacterium sp.]|jgi:thiol-disulfide isomerase/thioredoxin
MKTFLKILVLCSTLSHGLNAQDRVVTISPEHPRIGDTVTLTYNAAAKAAQHRDVTELTAEVLLARESEMALLLEVPMQKSGTLWKGSFKLTDDRTRVVLLRFVSGDVVDDNGEQCWDVLVFSTDGHPVRGAHLQRALIHRSRSYFGFNRQKNDDAAWADLAEEQRLYPDNWRATTLGWSLASRIKPGQETMLTIKQELEELYRKHENNEEVIISLLYWFEQTDQKERADFIRSEWLQKSPHGKVASAARQTAVFAERDPLRKVELLEQFLKDFPQTDDNLHSLLVSFCIQAKLYDKALDLLEHHPNPNPQSYNSIAWQLIEAGTDLEKAVSLAKKGLDLARNQNERSKPPYLSMRQWMRSKEYGIGMIADTYAFGIFKLGRFIEAEKAYEEAYHATQGREADINARLVECYVKNGKYSEAIRVADECVRKGKSNDDLLAFYKTAYTQKHGSEEGFLEAVNAARALVAREARTELLKNVLTIPAIDFALKDLKENTVRLSDLRGKIVVLDFWATWCGPCLSSFPTLQKIYDKYKGHPSIAILAVNTWENLKGEEMKQHVRKFMEENKYTFPVVFDEGMVEKYGVEGIPTKFVIDQNGIIRFKDLGFAGADAMEARMEQQFEFLLSENVSERK